MSEWSEALLTRIRFFHFFPSTGLAPAPAFKLW